MRGMYLLIYLFKAHFKDFLYVDEKVVIFYFGSMKVMINEAEDNLCRGQSPLEASITLLLYNEIQHYIFALVWRSNKGGVSHCGLAIYNLKVS
jgi:hypothetical protein